MSVPALRRQEHLVRGIAYVVVATLLFITMNTSALAGGVVLSVMVPFFWRTPSGWLQWLLFVSLGLVGGLGHYCVARAFSYGRAAVISPFHHVQVIWASLVGYAIFGHVPGLSTWLGAAVIIGSGLFIALVEASKPARPSVGPPRAG